MTKKHIITEPISLFPEAMQKHIAYALVNKRIRGEALTDALNSRLCDLEDTISLAKYKKMIEQGVEKFYVKGDFYVGDAWYFEMDDKSAVERLTFSKELNHAYKISTETDADGYFVTTLHLYQTLTPRMKIVGDSITYPSNCNLERKQLGCDTASFVLGLGDLQTSISTMADGYYGAVYWLPKLNEVIIQFDLDGAAISKESFEQTLRAVLESSYRK
ncbi:hypothetical protein [Solibacillus sp. NPDC093137]|uniref:hypothetical protein n=1 Tax=Solibacillus sp. NPDC093137 TaxID=3390678 RepID=UPI003D08876A